ncbi:MAG: GYF domain-containing protein [Bacteroidales bacterium]|nr:GYF domain-containing protein [Bacteroidales bacterium]MCD8393621.1 GYF domain-containing protein [Bacteroidales bacterium]
MAQYYIVYNGQQVGPMDAHQLLSYGLNPNSQVWREGMPAWQAAYTVPELMDIISQNHQAYPPQQPGQYVGASGKSQVVAGVLAILLGGLGVQYFYLGKIGGGFITILLSLCTCGVWSILTLIQGILMLTMPNQEFERKFVYSKSILPLF